MTHYWRNSRAVCVASLDDILPLCREQEKQRRAQERLDRQRDNGETLHNTLVCFVPSACIIRQPRITAILESLYNGHMHLAGKTAQQDILPVLCPTAMNDATTLRIMERLRGDEFTYEVNAGGALPLGRHGLCSMVWRRRVYRAAQQVIVYILFL